MRFRVLLEQDEDGMYVAEVPSLPGCISQGATRAEALANIKEAIAGYLESLAAHSDPMPPSIAVEVIMQFTVIIEEGPTSWGVYVPDLPGCAAVGETREEAMHLIREAIAFHLEGLREQGEPIPKPHSYGEVVEVDAA